MTSEEMEGAMDFIVQRQVAASAKIDALADAQTRTQEGINSLLAIAQMHPQEINTLGHQVSSLSRDIASLGETTRATDDRLYTLITVVERHVSEGHKGRHKMV